MGRLAFSESLRTLVLIDETNDGEAKSNSKKYSLSLSVLQRHSAS